MLPGCGVRSPRQVDSDSKMWFTFGGEPELSAGGDFIFTPAHLLRVPPKCAFCGM